MRAALHALVALAALAAYAAAASAATCGVSIMLSTPKTVSAGRQFTLSASIKNSRSTALSDFYFQLQLPDFLVPMTARAPANLGLKTNPPLLEGRFVRFRALRLPAHKTMRIKVTAGVPACQVNGEVMVQGIAYKLDDAGDVTCSTIANPVMTYVVRKNAWRNSSKGKRAAIPGNCTQPTPSAPLVLLGENERCLQAVPLPMVEDRRFRSLVGEPEANQQQLQKETSSRRVLATTYTAAACYACCGQYLGVAPPYYSNVNPDGRCLCCVDCTPIYAPLWTNFIALNESQWNKMEGASILTPSDINGDLNGYISVTSSANGSMLLATGLLSVYRSVNYGATWTKIDALDAAGGSLWSSVKCSSGFEVCLAFQGKGPSYGNGQVLRSVDGGLTWAAVSGMIQGAWGKAACDATGQKWVATLAFKWDPFGANGGIYVSTDYGESFTMVTGSDIVRWRSVACDDTMDYCVVGTANNGPPPFTSPVLVKAYSLTNLQTLAELSNSPEGDYRGLAMSADGDRVLAALEYEGADYDRFGYVWYSSDGGQTWTKADVPEGSYNDVACDSTFTHCAAAPEWDGTFSEIELITSCDGGLNWTSSPPLAKWASVTVDANGGRMVAGGYSPTTLYSFPLPVLSP